MLKLDRLSRRFGSTIAVADATLEIPAGQMVGIIGRSGSGKSTLLRLVARLIDPSEGHIWCDGTDIAQIKGRALRDWRADCALVGARAHLADHLDVATNVMIGRGHDLTPWRAVAQIFTPRERARAGSALDRVGLAQNARQKAQTMSHAQRQRIAIARALMHGPRMLLVDHVINRPDRGDGPSTLEVLCTLNQQDGLTVLCSPDRPEDARDCCDRIIGLVQGRVVFDGAPQDLTAQMARAFCDAATRDNRISASEAARYQTPAPILMPV